MLCRARIGFFFGVLLAALLAATGSPAAESNSAVSNLAPEDAPRPVIDLFAGIEAGSIEARVIPRNEKHVNLLLENKTPEPVTVRIPAALAAVPVLAQFDEFPWFEADRDRGRQQPQNVGLAPPWQGPRGPGAMNLPGGEPWNVPGAGLWSIPPERVARVRLTGVCLDHGLPTPRPKMPYELRPIDQVAARPEVAAICILLGRGEIDQVAAQLAAWHFHSEMRWDDLAAQRDQAAIGTVARYTRGQIRAARRAAEQAERLAEAMQPPQSPVSMR